MYHAERGKADKKVNKLSRKVNAVTLLFFIGIFISLPLGIIFEDVSILIFGMLFSFVVFLSSMIIGSKLIEEEEDKIRATERELYCEYDLVGLCLLRIAESAEEIEDALSSLR